MTLDVETLGRYPGGQPSARPPSTCRWRWKTLCPALAPSLTTTRKSVRPASFATWRATSSRWPSSAASSAPAAESLLQRLARDHQQVDGGLGTQVVEGDGELVLVDALRGQLPAQDPTQRRSPPYSASPLLSWTRNRGGSGCPNGNLAATTPRGSARPLKDSDRMPDAGLRRAALSLLDVRAKDRAPSPEGLGSPPWGEGGSEPESDGQVSRHHREAERGARHRRCARGLPRRRRLVRERRLRRDLRRRPSLRAAPARGDRPQVQALDPRRPAHPSEGVQVQGQEGADRPHPHDQEAARARRT